ncbi:hypothetical protein ACFL1T_03970 [Chlamydiota bacterium]
MDKTNKMDDESSIDDKQFKDQKKDHRIKCLDCGYTEKRCWEYGQECPHCSGKNFYPLVYVEDINKATGKSKKSVSEIIEKKINEGKKRVKSQYKKWLAILLLFLNILIWGKFLINNVDLIQREEHFSYPHFYRCFSCEKYFSRHSFEDVGRTRCPLCRSIKVKRIQNTRIAR